MKVNSKEVIPQVKPKVVNRRYVVTRGFMTNSFQNPSVSFKGGILSRLERILERFKRSPKLLVETSGESLVPEIISPVSTEQRARILERRMADLDERIRLLKPESD